MNNSIIHIRTYGNRDEGKLSFFEENKDIPFEIKRIYYIYGVKAGEKRGMHAHKKLQQVIWCPYGEVEIITDDGEQKTNYILNSPDKALLILKGHWRDIYWKKENSVLCVAASDYYDETDYIRDYDEYLYYIKKGC
ncbi:FdtA/QdtA family cupin domain-containing protein [Sedimentibacter sp.]|uniref:sugar 3,4-ketoisomerase n=1 Tax=Sedimentibacter sp. TaxID=1960295 RepID=UPI0028B04A01|nr:FdtA/QdtA family cupin domain-containing protein [Sedimentibacter sp.]